jgi:hypothetical protein
MQADRLSSGKSVYNDWVGRALQVIWLVLALVLLVALGQNLKLFDLPLVRDLPSMLPLGQGTPQPAARAPSPPPPTVTARSLAEPSPVLVRADVCSAAAPRFVLAMARLRARLGADMGTPTECERVVDAGGDTEQKTTTGLAYYRASVNTPVFTNGVEHWALTSDGLVHWTTDDLGPPPGAEVQR